LPKAGSNALQIVPGGQTLGCCTAQTIASLGPSQVGAHEMPVHAVTSPPAKTAPCAQQTRPGQSVGALHASSITLGTAPEPASIGSPAHCPAWPQCDAGTAVDQPVSLQQISPGWHGPLLHQTTGPPPLVELLVVVVHVELLAVLLALVDALLLVELTLVELALVVPALEAAVSPELVVPFAPPAPVELEPSATTR
jgi:hypothetical protein